MLIKYIEFQILGETGAEALDFKKLEEVINTNLPSFTGLEISVNSIKAKVIRSFGEFDTFAVSYNKEANTLRDNLEQVIAPISLSNHIYST